MKARPGSLRRQGFTLVELVAVFAVIALSLAVISPAVLQARKIARKVQCKNNLKQLGLALHNYNDIFQSLPPGYVVATKQSEVGAAIEMNWNAGNGWQTGLLMLIDQAPLFNQIEFSKGLPTAPEKIYSKQIPTYRCPEDTGTPLVAKVKVLGPLRENRKTAIVEKAFARSNYAGVSGWDNDWHLGITAKDGNPNGAADATGSNWTKPELGYDFRDGIAVYVGSPKTPDKKPVPNARDFHGTFGENSNRKMGQVSDGLSNVVMVGERATPTKNDSETDVGNIIWAGVPDRSTRVGQSLSLGTAYLPLNHELKEETVPNTTGFNSKHGGGANMLFGDGAVRFLTDKMDLGLLRKLSLVDDAIKVEIPQ